jgi:hypothetical protein
VYINGQPQTFENIYPNIHFIIQAKSSGNNTTVNQAVGISWRKNISITDDWKVDFTITLFISPDEQNLIWKSIISDPQNEKYKYQSTLNFIPNENKINIRVEK